ncbi:TPA: hypothetical protein ACH3X2_008148 [Trebouxia sp. C0005]
MLSRVSKAVQEGHRAYMRSQSDELRSSCMHADSSVFEKSARLLMGKFANLWLGPGDANPHLGSPQTPAAELVAIASQACATVAAEKTILCAVVENAQISIIFVAVSEALLSWEAYVEAVSGDGTGPGSARHDQGHCNAAVRRTVANQVPCVQLAELLASQPCKMVVCGRGSAAAVAQQTAYQLQQSLRLSTSVEDPSHRVMCITFGAPASFQCSPYQACPTSLFWNFLAVEYVDPDVIAQYCSDSDSEADSIAAEAPCGSGAATSNWIPVTTDLLPAVMTTIPHAAATGPPQWRLAVQHVMAAFSTYQQSPESHIKHNAGYLHDQLDLLYFSTGQDVVQTSFMGPTWFLPQTGMPVLAEAGPLQHILDIRNVVTTSLSRCLADTYTNAVKLLVHHQHVQQQGVNPSVAPANRGLLSQLKLGANITGLFKPTLEFVPEFEAEKGKVACMKGCHVTLHGPGVQWASKAPTIRMRGGGFDEIQMSTVIPQRKSHVIHQSGLSALPATS